MKGNGTSARSVSSIAVRVAKAVSALAYYPAIPARVITAACIAFAVPVMGSPDPVPLGRSHSEQIKQYGLGNWRLTLRTDAFSGEVRCSLVRRDGKVFYKSDAVGFRFGEHVNVSDAWFRVDDQAPQRWRDMLPILAANRVPIDGTNIIAPTDGIVWIPWQALDGRKDIAIQLWPGERAKTYSLVHLGELHDAGRRLGCPPEGRFQP